MVDQSVKERCPICGDMLEKTLGGEWMCTPCGYITEPDEPKTKANSQRGFT